MLQKLWTNHGRILRDQPEMMPWNVYPRPQMKRDSWLSLNGYWDFAVSEKDAMPEEYTKTIRVPFCPESMLSGIEKHYPEGAYLFYRRSLTLPAGFNRGRVLLHIGAAIRLPMFLSTESSCATMKTVTKPFPATLRMRWKKPTRLSSAARTI